MLYCSPVHFSIQVAKCIAKPSRRAMGIKNRRASLSDLGPIQLRWRSGGRCETPPHCVPLDRPRFAGCIVHRTGGDCATVQVVEMSSSAFVKVRIAAAVRCRLSSASGAERRIAARHTRCMAATRIETPIFGDPLGLFAPFIYDSRVGAGISYTFWPSLIRLRHVDAA